MGVRTQNVGKDDWIVVFDPWYDFFFLFLKKCVPGYIHVHRYIYIYIYMERERDRYKYI